jgi:outer membrane immunogenic protein
MKLRVFVGGFTLAAGTVACVCSVQAADLPMRPAPAPVAPVAYAPPVYNWSGFYIGGHIGGGFENSSWTDPFTGSNDTFNNSGFLGGAQIGVNTQFNWLVLGLEGDFSWTSAIKGTGTDSFGDSITTSPQWTSTVTGRIGAAFDRLLVYGKGGVAFAEDKSTFTPVGGATATDTTTRVGWTAQLHACDDKRGSQCPGSKGRLRLQVRAVIKQPVANREWRVGSDVGSLLGARY